MIIYNYYYHLCSVLI